METDYSNAVHTAKDYYNSQDADNFYFTIWGGEDIHIGIYQSPEDSIFDASRRTVARMASHLDGLSRDSRILDIGSGFGGAARYLAATYGCRVVALNLSEVENGRHRKINEEEGLDRLIEVVDGSFEDIPYPDGSFDAVWSQDAILHSGDRVRVLEEVGRVLKAGGDLVFTDPMQADDCPAGVLKPILERIHLETLASPEFYLKTAERLGMERVSFEDLTPQLINHYSRVLQETEHREGQLREVVHPDYIQRMKPGLQRWIDGGERGYLVWGIFQFRKS
jgi:sarcosine/dimethylglycine N-methyltransferase